MAEIRLDDNQRRAVESDSPCIIIDAGAGSGKTRVAITRVCRLVEEKSVAPESILMMTFTRAAAGEMRERLRVQLGEKKADAVWIGTIHKFCLEILKKHGNTIGYDTDGEISIFDEDDRVQIIKQIAQELYPKKAPSTQKVMKYLYDDVMDDEDMMTVKQLKLLRSEYFSILMRDNAIDLDGILYATRRILTERPSIAAEIQTQFKHILVDEFQDTSGVQIDIIEAIKPRNFVGIGDPDQCIYQWRGARPELMIEKAKQAGVELIQLPSNYRCTIPIVMAARAIIEQNPNRLDKPLAAIREGSAPTIIGFETDVEEANEIAKMIAGSECPNDYAVLCRTNYQIETIYNALTMHKVPAILVNGQADILKQPDIKKIFQFLDVAYNPRNNDLHKWIVNWPQTRLTSSEMRKIDVVTLTKGASLLDVLRAHESGQRYTNVIDQTRQKMNETNRAIELFDHVVELLGLKEMYDRQKRQNKISDIEHARDRIMKWEETEKSLGYSGRISSFLKWLKYRDLQDRLLENKEGVKCMTVHGAKGLEFPNVIIAGFNEGIFPSAKSPIEEEMNLAYVAFTRAKDNLMITWAKSRMTEWSGEPERLRPSGFIDVIADLCGGDNDG